MVEDLRTLVEIQARSYDRAGAALRDSYPKSSAMDGRRLAEFFERKRYAVLATARPDGRPQAAPVAFSVWGGAFWIATVEGARLRNLRTRPYASIVITEGDVRAHHRAVVAEGPVRLCEVRELAAMDPGFADQWRARHGALPTWAAALVELRPERLFSFDGTLEQR